MMNYDNNIMESNKERLQHKYNDTIHYMAKSTLPPYRCCEFMWKLHDAIHE